MEKFIFTLAIGLLSLTPLLAQAQRTTENFDSGWQFSLMPSTNSKDMSMPSDGTFRPVDLPHDWSVESDFIRDAPAGNDGAYLPTGTGWYKKTFQVPADDKGKDLSLYFEGVYMNSTVYVNGDSIGGHPYGYSSFWVNLTPYLKYEEDNTVSVRVDNSAQRNCRWYTGSGIYRHVWLVTTPATHIDEWGVHIIPIKNGTGNEWNLQIKISYTDPEGSHPEFRNTVYDMQGKEVASSVGGDPDQTIKIDNPRLWSTDEPNLYTVKSQLIVDNRVVDEVTNTTGFRTLEYDAKGGFRLNGKPMAITGGSVHHDNGVLGARSFDAAEARKVRLLKEAGFNAVRTSHNPVAPAFLDECDRQGLLVIEDAFDGWREQKTEHDYAELFDKYWDKDIEAMVRRDRNHPSIMAWCIGNEVIERKKIEIVTTAHKLAEKCRELDPTGRPITSALASWDSDWEIYDPLAAELDIVGYNYMIHKSESDHARVPDRVMWQTESYPRDAFQNWVKVNDNSYIIGDFVWTAIDYLGESGIGRHYYKGEVEGEHYHRPLWPWHGAPCGDIDLTGLRKPLSYYREMLYSPAEKVYMAVREPEGYKGEIQETLWGKYPTYESWNWPGHEGKPIEVEIISRFPKVHLSMNGKTIGEKEVSRATEFKAIFEIPYMPGSITAEGLDNDGNVKDTFTIATAGEPYAIRLTPDKTSMRADNQDLIFVIAEIIDKNGNVVPVADNEITFEATGKGTLIATGSADVKDTRSYCSNVRKASEGRSIAVVRASKTPGNTTLKASAKGLKQASVKLKSQR